MDGATATIHVYHVQSDQRKELPQRRTQPALYSYRAFYWHESPSPCPDIGVIDADRNDVLSLSTPPSHRHCVFDFLSPAFLNKTNAKNGRLIAPKHAPGHPAHVTASCHHRLPRGSARVSDGVEPERLLYPPQREWDFQAAAQRSSQGLMQEQAIALLRRDTLVQSVQQKRVNAGGPQQPAHRAKTSRPVPLHREMALAPLHRVRRYTAALLILRGRGR